MIDPNFAVSTLALIVALISLYLDHRPRHHSREI